MGDREPAPFRQFSGGDDYQRQVPSRTSALMPAPSRISSWDATKPLVSGNSPSRQSSTDSADEYRLFPSTIAEERLGYQPHKLSNASSTATAVEGGDRAPTFANGSAPIAPIAWRARPLEKIALLSSCAIPMVAGATLFHEWMHDSRTTGPFLEIVIAQRATVQIIVSIISAMLAALNVFIITTLINQAARIRLCEKPLSLNSIKFIGAVASRRYGVGLPIPLFMGALTAILLFAIPNVLWTGALTPIIVTKNVTQAASMPLPRYSVASNATWSQNSQILRDTCHTQLNSGGIFSDCATATIQSSMLERASSASVNASQLNGKIDASHYSYVGRSYGVGGAVGIFGGGIAGHLTDKTVVGYNYTEPGYMTSVTCAHNESILYGIVPIQGSVENPDNGTPSLFSAEGYFPWETPNADLSNIEHFAVVGFDEDNLAVLSCKEETPKNGTKMIIMVAGKSYNFLNATQCEVTFTPTQYMVNVDVTQKLIRVEPMHELPSDAFDPTGGLGTTLVNQMNALSMIATSLYTSTVGDALSANVDQSTQSDKFADLSDSYQVMFDDLLAFVGSSQFFVPFSGAGDFSLATTQVTVQAVQVGEAQYVLATFAMCVVLILMVMEEAVRTRAWRFLPRWDLTDPTCLILAGAVAGKDLLSRVEERDLNSGKGVWTGDGREALGGAKLRIGHRVVPTTNTVAAVGGLGPAGDEKYVGPTADGDGYYMSAPHLTAVSFMTKTSKDAYPLRQ